MSHDRVAALFSTTHDLKRRGYFVIPVSLYSQKNPHGWRNMRDEGALDLVDWFTGEDETPYSNIGIITGNGLLVIDLDNKNGANGIEAFHEACAEQGYSPPRPTVYTKSGGHHIYYRYRSPIDKLRSINNLWPGVDALLWGNRATCPPSVGKDGGEYTWVDGLPVKKSLLPLAPSWIMQLIHSRQKEKWHRRKR